MKIGIRTNTLGQVVPGAFATAGHLGFDGVEVVTREEARLRTWLEEDGPDGAAALRAAASRAGVAVTSLSPAGYRRVNFAQPDDALRQEGIALVSDALRACRNIGGTVVQLPYFDRERFDVSPEEERRFVDGLQAVAPVAEATGVAVTIETSCSAAQLRRIVDAVGSPWVGVYQDLANAVRFGQDPAATLRALGSAVLMVHVKDTPGDGQAPLGEGVVAWDECRRALHDIGYDGWCVLETPPGDDPLAAASRYLEFTRRWLDRA